MFAVFVASDRCAAGESSNAPPLVLQVPEGFTIELVAGPPLTERPIVASFDDDGRLYVAESSGSNDPVEKQLEERPHRIARLEDIDGDGKFDKRTLFADRMMLPEGALFFDGSLYVSAPPSIWKLTDNDGDGDADERVEWFQGKTLTGCANDLHGPYLGPDGWIYWCKGAFAEQTHIVHGREWKSRAAHIFRCRPDGTGLEPVLTGGMDNPVDVTFTPEGERILSATFLEGDGRRDGIVHAIYGGVYGKEHGVLAGHARTGELMPALVWMDAAAPCGLERYDSDAFGPEYRDNLFACQFNLRRVSRHVLNEEGSTFRSEDSDFVTSENVDFHPTDVLVDADGSLLVIDTGGWYKLCCPTSQLWKPDVLGGVYRVRRQGAVAPADPRGRLIAWHELTAEQLWSLHGDARPAVRQRASRELAKRQNTEVTTDFIAWLTAQGATAAIEWTASGGGARAESCDATTAGLARTWTLAKLETDLARSLVRKLLFHPNKRIRHAALSAVSLHRDAKAMTRLVEILENDTAANRRAAAEALGRIGNSAAVPRLLAAAAVADDRILEHSVTYALIEIADSGATQAGLASKSPGTVRAALMALDQMPGGGVRPEQVVPLLNADDATLRDTARWVVGHHAEWGDDLAEWFRGRLAALRDEPHSNGAPRSVEEADEVESMLVPFTGHPAIQQLLADTVVERDRSTAARCTALRVMAQATVTPPPKSWRTALAEVIQSADIDMVRLAVTAARNQTAADTPLGRLDESLLVVADSPQFPLEVRVEALAAVVGRLPEITDAQWELLLDGLAQENDSHLRSAAADAIGRARLTPQQLSQLCEAIRAAGPLELNRLLSPFEHSTDEHLARKLLATLKESSALPSLRIDVLRGALANHGAAVQQGVAELEALVNVDAAAQRARIEELLPQMARGDVRRGHAVFYSSKAACSACHRLGYAGGTAGPELTRIGEIRSERDLLESILYPSLSLVRSYETMLITTIDGRTIHGFVRDETEDEYVVVVSAEQEVRVRREDVEEIAPSATSIMPAGIDKQLSTEELADLVAFLKDATGK